MKKGQDRVLAFDMGGTKIASAVVELCGSDYRILDYRKSETPQQRQEIIAKLLELVAAYQQEHVFSRIGLAVAGQVNPAGDTIISSPNLLELNGCKLGRIIESKTGFGTSLKNDVRCFALGEDRFGKYAGHDSAVFLAVGTGVGGAIKLNGQFYSGGDNIAGEFGHMVIVQDGEICGCGRRGCFERYVGGPAVERMYRKEYGEEKNAKDIVHDAVRGDTRSRAIMERASSYFAIGLANIVNVLDPQIVVVGGSMVKEKRLLPLALPLIRSEVLLPARRIKIVNSSLGDDAFLLGAAVA